MEPEGGAAAGRGVRRAAHRRALPPAPGPGGPAPARGRLPGVQLLPGERQPRPGRLHAGPGPHRRAPAARGPPAAHRGPGRELLPGGARGADPRGAPGRGPGVRQSEGERLHPDPDGGVHPARGHEGGRGRRQRHLLRQGQEGVRSRVEGWQPSAQCSSMDTEREGW